MAQLVKNPPAMRETWVWSLGWEDPLEKGKATHSSIPPGEFHELYRPWGRKDLDMTEWPSVSLSMDAAAKSLQLCPTLCDPMDCSLPGSSIHGIFQAKVLEWGAMDT